jgi:hypothetical protein
VVPQNNWVPFEPIETDLVINLQTAKALGLEVPWFLQQFGQSARQTSEARREGFGAFSNGCSKMGDHNTGRMVGAGIGTTRFVNFFGNITSTPPPACP